MKQQNYEKNRRKAGFVVLTKANKALAVLCKGSLCLLKGKEDFYDNNLQATAIREVKEETGMFSGMYRFVVCCENCF